MKIRPVLYELSRVTKIEVMKFYIFFCRVARNRTLLSILCQRAIFLILFLHNKKVGWIRAQRNVFGDFNPRASK